MRNNSKIKNKKGFTLIEMMVAVSIFVIVAFIVVSTLLAMSYSYKKAQRLRILMDNLGFSLQSMSINIREGIDYDQSGCSSDQDCVKFTPIDSWLSTPSGNAVCYSLEGTNVRKCEIAGEADSCPCSPGTGSLFVSPEIKVSTLKFIIDPSPSPSNRFIQKKIKIMIAGEAGAVPREKTNFFIQNTVSQRNIGG